jgi:hypothetical protein
MNIIESFCYLKGMAFSGAEDEQMNQQMVDKLTSQHSNLSNNYYLTTDSVGTIATSLKNG